ncbi:unnamed protein product [Chilo suppressalis]|uniref:WW domain-binding protein 4 n=1 Tax=Chilo suppressalis TaxID=168631 RepID=A0ABN8BAZ7_CHISP|nr:unnamed protein product [Chilo suppressalis]
MTEYWKSQARKYCEFCKCWFADNKVSISFHENGKRHKESVQKHISQLSKKSAKEFKQQGKMDEDIKKMEAAAMAAYLKDVQNNADLTSKNINKMLDENSSNDVVVTTVAASNTKKQPVWHEVKNDDGSSYYWNKVTNETTWDTPDSFLSIVDQEKEKLKKGKSDKVKEKQKKEMHKEAVKEVNAHIARERMKELAPKREESSAPVATYGPAPRASVPYGSWTPVVNERIQNVDLQLPKTKEVEPPPVVMEPETVEFREKRVESLGDGPVEFKRRKLNNARRNMRQKLDDE